MLKDNWPEARERYRAFWNHEPLDHPPILFDSVGPHTNPMYNGAGYNYQKYGEDITSFCHDYARVWEARSACLDDTVPCIAPQMGGAIEAALWAGEVVWGEETTSLTPHNPLADVACLDEIEFDASNTYYQRIVRELAFLASCARGRFGVNFEPSVSITTTISQLRGGTQFMFDLIDDPGGIRQFAERIADLLIGLQQQVDALIPRPDGGTCHRWLNYWNPGRGFWFSEDDAMMLSPAMYRDMFLDLDRRLCGSTDCPVAHWHSGGLHLVGELLGIENLRMVQLSLDPNGPDMASVLDFCQSIERAGRKVCFQLSYDESLIAAIFRMVRPDSCMFYLSHADSLRGANAIVASVERLAHSRPRR
jgi:hypothetical protein